MGHDPSPFLFAMPAIRTVGMSRFEKMGQNCIFAVKIQTMTDLQSRTIDTLRFPLMLGVVFIHSAFMSYFYPDGRTVFDLENMPVYSLAAYIFSDNLGQIAVPLFFFMSGYLFFYGNGGGFGWRGYLVKLKKRCRTLLVPYVVWNVVYALCFLAAQEFFPEAMSGRIKPLSESGVLDILNLFWGVGNGDSPIAGQFWFIKYLMLMVVAAPLFYLLIARCPRAVVFAVAVAGVADNLFDVSGLWYTPVLFFGWGAYYSINGKEFVFSFRRIGNVALLLYPAVLALNILLFHLSGENPRLSLNVGVYVGLVAAVRAVSLLVGRRNFRVRAFFPRSSFFLFACHGIMCATLCKIAVKVVPADCDLMAVAVYFSIVFGVTAVCLAAYYVMDKYLPKLTAVITGGR